MPENPQGSLFTELTDRESAAVSGASISGCVSGASSTYGTTNSDQGTQSLFLLPNSRQFYIYDPTRARPYKTLVV
jgi:hypothetical protein